jgi:hypothetical protein
MVIGNPFPLKQNADKSFIGSYVLGMGFVLTPEQANQLIHKDARNKDVIYPYLNGEDLNNDPEQKPSRWVINFFDWDEDKARSYPDCYEIIERLVKPERQRWKVDENGNSIVGTYALRKPLPQKWWIYGEKRPALYSTISQLDQVMVIALTSKTVAIALIPSNQVFSHSLGIFSSKEYYLLALLQSTIHNLWSWLNGSSMKSDLRYTPSVCFETFPFPANFPGIHKEKLSEIGENYNKLRANIMNCTQIGLTRVYGLFHENKLKMATSNNFAMDDKVFEQSFGKNGGWLKKNLQDSNYIKFNDVCGKIKDLRNLHEEIDRLIIELYGWSDIQLRHGFYEVEYLPEQDRTRFTVHPDARKEILKRLLKLNHQIHKVETADKKQTVKGSKKKKNDISPTLFS